MTEYLLRELRGMGLRVAYLSRGYGRKTKGYVQVTPDSTPQQVGDEALQVALKLQDVPAAVCENRVIGANKLIANFKLDCIVLDDAFQHRRIDRMADIVMVDANRPPWMDALLPAGFLREPISSLLRASLIVVNKVTPKSNIPSFQRRFGKLGLPSAYATLAPLRLVPFRDGEQYKPESLKNRHCVVFSGLGNNEAFFETLRSLGVKIIQSYSFADHRRYTEDDLKRITYHYRKLAKIESLVESPLIITTEKDYVRMQSDKLFQLLFKQYPFYYLEVGLQFIEGKEIFEGFLHTLINNNASRRSAAVQ